MKILMQKPVQVFKLLFTIVCCIIVSVKVEAQVTADPATGQMDLTSPTGVPENANYISPEKLLILKVPVYNLNQVNSVPAASCSLTINLGNYLVLAPGFAVNTAPLNNYFNWTSYNTPTGVEIKGVLHTPLPEDFAGMAEFSIKSTVTGTSEIVSEFHILNPPGTLIDEDLANNLATLQYTVTTTVPVPVRFTGLQVNIDQCRANYSFFCENEVNVRLYVIETSFDGLNFQRADDVPANKKPIYSGSFQVRGGADRQKLFVRIKAVDIDGTYKYSDVTSVRNNCTGFGVSVFPNPVPQSNRTLSIRLNRSLQDRSPVTIQLWDARGRLAINKVISGNNFLLSLESLAAGQYFFACGHANNQAPEAHIIELY